jgi:hypothetical protein
MKKSHRIIRDEINYGNLSVFEFAGIRFVARSESASDLGLTPIEVEEIPQLVTHLRIDISSRIEYNWHSIYVLDKKDIIPLCKAYSGTTRRRMRVLGAARILGDWTNGEALVTVRTLDHYYENESKENIEHFSF